MRQHFWLVGLAAALGSVAPAAAPLLTVEPLPTLTRARTITVRGETVPGSEVTVSLAAQTAKLLAGADGRFEVGPLELAEGLNDILITSRKDGDAAYTTCTVAADRQPPPLMLTGPWDNPAEGATEPAALRGATEPGCTVIARLGSRDLPAAKADEQGLFTMALPADLPDGTHQLELVVADPAGNETRIEREVVTDVTPPDLALAAPGDTDFTTRWRRLALSGRVEPGARLRVRLNDQPMLLTAITEDGQFALLGLPLRPGANQLVLEAVDGLGNRSVLQRQFTLDTADPGLVLDPPLNEPVWRTSAPVLVVRGRTEPGATVTVTGLPAGPLAQTAGADGRLEGLVGMLPDSSAPLTITARDAAGNTTVLQRWVAVDRQPPAVQVTYPGPLPYVEQSPFRLAGRTEPGALLVLRCGETELQAVAAENGAFAFDAVPVSDGRNTMVLTATDALGNARIVPIDVLARLGPLWLRVTEPEEGWQSASPTRLALVTEADATVSGTLDGRALTDWQLAPPVTAYHDPSIVVPAVVVKPTDLAQPSMDLPPPPPPLGDDPPWRAALAELPPLSPGPHRLVVTAVSPTGLRSAREDLAIHVPGVPRAVLLRGAEQQEDGSVVVAAQALDDWGMPVADGTPLEFRAPAGWLIDEREAVVVHTGGGNAVARLRPVREPRRGIVMVSVGRVTESVRLPVR